MDSKSEVAFDTKDDHLVSNLYRGSITAVPTLETELYVWGCANQVSNWIVLNWRTRRWRIVEAVSNVDAPSARHAHTATYFPMRGELFIAVLGGSASSANDSNPPFADVYIYNVNQRLWLPVPLASVSQAGAEQLTPRLFHSATFVEIEHEPYLAVVGGIFSDRTLAVNVPIPTMVNRRALVLPELRFYNLRLRTWSHPVYVPGRYRHSAVLVPSPGRDPKLMTVGGRDMRGGLSKEALIIDIRAAFQSLKYSSPLLQKPLAEDYGQGVYWSWLAGIVQPLGPYYGNCHIVPHADSLIIFALPDRTAAQTHNQPQLQHVGRERGSSRGSSSRNESRTRLSEQPTPSYRYDAHAGHSGWALSFSGGSASYRELRKLRRVAQKAEVAARSLAALTADAQVQTPPELLEPPIAPALHMQPPTPAPSAPPKSSWLWCGVVRSGWGTTTGGEEDLLLMLYQAEGRTSLVPVLLSALGIPRSGSGEAESGFSGTGVRLVGLLPPLWDGSPEMPSGSRLDATVPPFTDFFLNTSTRTAPPLAVHRNILLSRSTYFSALLISGFSESRTGEASVEEGYAAAYAMCYWIYTNTLPAWLETPGAFCSDWGSGSLPVESRYAAHAGETLCELLIAANARMLPALVTRVRTLIQTEHMHAPELAPLVWRAAELTDVTDTDELVPFALVRAEDSAGRWVADSIRAQVRPAEDRKSFTTAVGRWCCEGGAEVREAMEGAKEWMEPEVWGSWAAKCAKARGEGTVKGDREDQRDVAMKSA